MVNSLNFVSETDLNKRIGDDIEQQGYSIVEQALPNELLENLGLQVKRSQPDQFKLGGIGRETGVQTNSEIRSDQIMWLNETAEEAVEYFKWAEQLRHSLNQRFYLGLFEYECMFAHYPKGAFYQKHVDAFRHSSNRKISTILYLNKNWHDEDGGELVLYQPDEEHAFKSVVPALGTLVVFLSEDFPHEVLPAKKSRYSLTGWFKIKS